MSETLGFVAEAQPNPSCHVCGTTMQKHYACAACGATTNPTTPPGKLLSLLVSADRSEYYNFQELLQLWESRDGCLSITMGERLINYLIVRVRELKKKLHNEYRASIGEVWHWEANSTDNNLESLTCPILISATDLKELISKKEAG